MLEEELDDILEEFQSERNPGVLKLIGDANLIGCGLGVDQDKSFIGEMDKFLADLGGWSANNQSSSGRQLSNAKTQCTDLDDLSDLTDNLHNRT